MIRVVTALVSLTVLCACTTKRVLEVHTNPPGAHIWVNGVHLEDRTPIEIPFTHYGFWDIRVEKAGYDAVAKEIHVNAGIDGYPVVDLLIETVVPEKRFRRTIDLPRREHCTEADVQGLLETARAFRKRAREEAAAADVPERLLPGTDDLLP